MNIEIRTETQQEKLYKIIIQNSEKATKAIKIAVLDEIMKQQAMEKTSLTIETQHIKQGHQGYKNRGVGRNHENNRRWRLYIAASPVNGGSQWKLEEARWESLKMNERRSVATQIEKGFAENTRKKLMLGVYKTTQGHDS